MGGFTKGPWHVVLSNNATPIVMHGAGIDGSDYEDLTSRVCAMPAEISMSFNSMANASLIAAAPDLLEALEALLFAYQDPGNEGSTHDAKVLAAKTAIARARGI